ncbi:hypothetical protein LBMAG39_15150 [Cyanobium sp.]|jgi:hypothetical protein|nr:hypothetical protein LBMAG39_15150 [Cyanobium sp.]
MDERSVFALTPEELRQRLERAFDLECDLDPMILRARLLRQRGSNPQARCLEQELLPLF